MGYNPGRPTAVRCIGERLYQMESFRGMDIAYIIDLNKMTCTCPHFTERLIGTTQVCKHITQVLQQETDENLVDRARQCSDEDLRRLLVRYRTSGQMDICSAILVIQQERRQRQIEDAMLREIFR